MDRARQTPMYDPVSQLVYVTRGDDVETTIVNGKILMRGRKVLTLNEARVLTQVRQAADCRCERPSAPRDEHWGAEIYSRTPMYGRLRYCSA